MRSTKLKIARENDKINYYIDGVLQCSVDDPQPNTAMIIDFAMYQYGRSIYGLEIGAVNYLADIRQSTDYSPFGVLLERRNLSLTRGTGGVPYRYSFQGQEHDDEIKGAGNSVNYKYRMHDPRLGRFFAIDPLAPDYPWNSPYAFSENIVINAVELEGLEKVNTFYYNYETKSFPKKPDSKSVDNSLNKNINVYVYGYPNGGVKRTVVKSWDKTKVASSYGSMDPQLLHSNFGSISISASKSADKTHYDSWEGAANGADGQTKQTKKDYVVAGKVVVGIVTLGYGGGAIMAGEVGLLSVSSTVFAADDITGTVIGAAKDDLDGEYKPIKCGLKYTMGDFGVITYDALNLTAGTTSKFKNLVDLSKSKTSSIIPNFLDNYGLSSGGTETAGDVKELIYPTDAKKK